MCEWRISFQLSTLYCPLNNLQEPAYIHFVQTYGLGRLNPGSPPVYSDEMQSLDPINADPMQPFPAAKEEKS
jgi:hypothetical protein